MRLSIAAIGMGRQSLEQKLAEQWFNKLPHKGKILQCTSKLPHNANRKKDESLKILSAIPHNALIFAMTPHGRNVSSEELAELIARHRELGQRDAVFAIGGADGHGNELLNQAHHKLAFGRLTWPHMLFRAMLAEQLFRAEMILAKHPYHHA